MFGPFRRFGPVQLHEVQLGRGDRVEDFRERLVLEHADEERSGGGECRGERGEQSVGVGGEPRFVRDDSIHGGFGDRSEESGAVYRGRDFERRGMNRLLVGTNISPSMSAPDSAAASAYSSATGKLQGSMATSSLYNRRVTATNVLKMSSDLADRDAADHEKHSLTSAEKIDGVPRKWKVYDEYGTVEDKKLLSKFDLRLGWTDCCRCCRSCIRSAFRIGLIWETQSFVTNQASLFGIRYRLFCDAVLGATEAGLYPGVIYLFSTYYFRRERHWRVAVFFGGAALAGAFGGVLAYAIGKMDGIGGKRGWQWIFILEGLLTVVVSVVAYRIVPTTHKAKWLTEAERSRLLARLAADSDTANMEKFEWVYVRQAFTDHLVRGYALLFHGHAFVLYTLSLFMLLANESWPSENVYNQTKRAVAVAMQITIGDLGAVTGVLIYRPEWEKDHYRKPHSIAIGYLSFAIVVASALWWWMDKENWRRAEILGSAGGEVDDALGKVDFEDDRRERG
ncbi:major facilitator superfamily domain-containing protein [Cytidiella melzeri]|nr:major facilitator superfamily domain-containing protein [Cytidiella melzeri]